VAVRGRGEGAGWAGEGVDTIKGKERVACNIRSYTLYSRGTKVSTVLTGH